MAFFDVASGLAARIAAGAGWGMAMRIAMARGAAPWAAVVSICEFLG